jgi:hypothetical protein
MFLPFLAISFTGHCNLDPRIPCTLFSPFLTSRKILSSPVKVKTDRKGSEGEGRIMNKLSIPVKAIRPQELAKHYPVKASGDLKMGNC